MKQWVGRAFKQLKMTFKVICSH